MSGSLAGAHLCAHSKREALALIRSDPGYPPSVSNHERRPVVSYQSGSRGRILGVVSFGTEFWGSVANQNRRTGRSSSSMRPGAGYGQVLDGEVFWSKQNQEDGFSLGLKRHVKERSVVSTSTVRGGLLLTAVAATVATTATTEAAAATAATVATGAGARGVGEVDTDVATVQLLLVEALNGGLSLIGGLEGDEAEAARAASLAVLHDNAVNDIAVLGEGIAERVVSGVPRQVADVKLGHDCSGW